MKGTGVFLWLNYQLRHITIISFAHLHMVKFAHSYYFQNSIKSVGSGLSSKCLYIKRTFSWPL